MQELPQHFDPQRRSKSAILVLDQSEMCVCVCLQRLANPVFHVSPFRNVKLSGEFELHLNYSTWPQVFEAKGFFLSQGQKGEPGDLPYVSSLQEEPTQIIPGVLMMVVIKGGHCFRWRGHPDYQDLRWVTSSRCLR